MSQHKREAAIPVVDLENEFPNRAAQFVDNFLRRRGDYLRAQVAKIATEYLADDIAAEAFFGPANEELEQRLDGNDRDESIEDTLIVGPN